MLDFKQFLTQFTNKFFLAGIIFWVIGIGYALSLGFKALIAVALMGIGNFLYDLSKGDSDDS